MAKVKEYRGKQMGPVHEDPRNVADRHFFLFGDAHNKTTLSPVYDVAWNPHSSGWTNSQWGHVEGQPTTTQRGYMGVKKQVTYVNHNNSTTSYSSFYTSNGVDKSWNRYMDEDEMCGAYTYVADDGSTKSIMCQYKDWYFNTTDHYWIFYNNIPDTAQMSNRNPNYTGSDSYRATLFYMNTDDIKNGRFTGTRDYSSSSGNPYDNMHQWIGFYTHPNYTGYNASTSNMDQNGYQLQHLGKSSVTGNRLYVMHNPQTSSYSYGSGRMKLVDVGYDTGSGAPTVTVNTTIQNSIPAAGTHSGGNFMNAFSSNGQPRRYATKHFTDPRDSNGKIFYIPYFDQYYDFHPLLYKWDTTNDTITREDDISITGDKSSVHADLSTAMANHTSDNYNYNYQQIWCDHFVSGGNRYISFIITGGKHNHFATTEGGRTVVTYAIDSANPKALTYHSKLVMAKSISHTVYLNDARTLMAMFYTGGAYIMSWNNSTGWGITATLTDHVHMMGRDSTDRIWYYTKNASHGYMDVHLLSPTLPVSVTLTPASTSYTYSGSNINSTVAVDARNAAGTRIATSVKLVIEGASMTFSGGATTTTVTTSTSGATDVNIIVTGSGFSNIIASIEI